MMNRVVEDRDGKRVRDRIRGVDMGSPAAG
jgi:hypothetical protein